MHFFKGEWADSYQKILLRVKESGEIIGKSKCIFNLFFEISPNDVLIIPEKNWKWAFVELFDRLNPNYANPGRSFNYRPHWKRKLESEGGKFCYNYNERLWPQLYYVYDILKSSKSSKEAVVTILDKDDLSNKLPRIPCTISLQFYLNHLKQLCLHVNMRTNDVVNLLIYDVFHHSIFQRMVASKLGLALGTYSHHATIAYFQKKREAVGYIDRLLESKLVEYKISSLDNDFIDQLSQCIVSVSNNTNSLKFNDVFIQDFYKALNLLFYNIETEFKMDFFKEVFK